MAGPFPARIGYAGWVAAQVRVQSTGTTPAGTFTLRRAFGALADPGTTLPYIRFDDTDYWPYEPRDPATYNVYQYSKSPKTHWRPGYTEHLIDFLPDYDYAAVIGFNLPRHISYSASRGQRVARRPRRHPARRRHLPARTRRRTDGRLRGDRGAADAMDAELAAGGAATPDRDGPLGLRPLTVMARRRWPAPSREGSAQRRPPSARTNPFGDTTCR